MSYVEHQGFPGIRQAFREHLTSASVQDFNRHAAGYFFVEGDCYFILKGIWIDLQLFLPIGFGCACFDRGSHRSHFLGRQATA